MWTVADKRGGLLVACVILRLGLEERQVGNGRNCDDSFIQRRLRRCRLKRRVAAIRPADDRKAVWIGDALLGEIASRGRNVANRGPPALEAILRKPGIAEAAGAAIFRLNHSISSRSEELRQPVETPFVA